MELKNSTGLINSKINKRKIGIKADRREFILELSVLWNRINPTQNLTTLSSVVELKKN